MNQELEAIKAEFEAFNHEIHGTEHFNQARTLADAYVEAHPDEFTDARGEKPGVMVADLKQALTVLDAHIQQNPADHAAVAATQLTAGLLSDGPLRLEECVRAVDLFRTAGLDDALWRVEAWLLHRFEPQNIGTHNAPPKPQIRTPGTHFEMADGLAVRKTN